jgi:hypothetical protein
MEIQINSSGIDFTIQPKGGVVKRFAVHKGHKIDLPDLAFSDPSLDSLRLCLDSLLPVEAAMIKALKLAPKQEKINVAEEARPRQVQAENNAKQQKTKTTKEPKKQHKDTDFQSVAFVDTDSYVGKVLDSGKKPDFRHRLEGNKPSIRPAIDIRLDDGSLVRIFGAGLPACLAAANADVGDRIKITLVKRGSQGMSNQYEIQKI